MKTKLCKIFCTVLCAFFVLTSAGMYCAAVNVSDGGKVYPFGDANGDGRIDIIDFVRMKKHIADGNIDILRVAADINGDNSVDATDLTEFRRYMLGIASAVDNGGDFWTSVY